MKIPVQISFPILLTILLLACNLKLPKSVETKKETIDATVGKWVHADPIKSDIKDIIFTSKKNKNGDYMYVWEYVTKNSNGKMSDSGTWRYAAVGKIEIFDVDNNSFVLPLYFIDDHSLNLLESDKYIKDE